MSSQLLLINPRRKRRRRVKNARKRRRVRAVKVTRRRRRRTAGGYKIRRRRHKNPRARRHRHRLRNPRMRRRRHRNPISMGGIKSALIPAAYGAAGGVALDFAYTFFQPYLPTSITGINPYMPNVIKIAGAFGIGMLAEKFVGSEKGKAVMAGALAIQLYNLAAQLLGGTGGMAGLAAYMRPMSGLGSANPAMYLQKPPGMGRLGRMGRMGRMGAYMTQPAVITQSGALHGLDGMGNGM